MLVRLLMRLFLLFDWIVQEMEGFWARGRGLEKRKV